MLRVLDVPMLLRRALDVRSFDRYEFVYEKKKRKEEKQKVLQELWSRRCCGQGYATAIVPPRTAVRTDPRDPPSASWGSAGWVGAG